MIVRPRPKIHELLYIMRGSIVPLILPQIGLTAALSAAVVTAHALWPLHVPAFAGAPFALLGIALSVFLGFRNNVCYDRWWEARRQWGELIAASRTLARQTPVLPEAARARLLALAMAFAHALGEALRPEMARGKADRFLTPDDRQALAAGPNRPDAILRLMAAELAALRRAGTIGDIPWQALDQTLARMGLVQAACERIRGTPIPFAYTLLLHRTAYLFCFLLPFGFADTLGFVTPLATALVAYAFFGLDALGNALEDPFDSNPHGVPLSAMADTIEINLRDALGETDLPPLPVPVDHILM